MKPQKIVRILYFRCGMAQKRPADLRFFDPAAVVADPDETDAAVFYFSSFTMLEGRSTTSPAAILSIVS